MTDNYKTKNITFTLDTGTLKARPVRDVPVRVTEGGQLVAEDVEEVLNILWELTPLSPAESWMLVNDGIGTFETPALFRSDIYMVTYKDDTVAAVQIYS